ncbi:type II CRISPR-associated endonuclease Cas1 [Paenibacillus sp. CMAA1364]
MSWRTVVIAKDAKVSLRLNHLIVSNESVAKIPLQEISAVVVENPNIVLTGHLMNALASENIMTLICDQEYNPATLLQPLYGHHRQARKIKEQFSWSGEQKGQLWQQVIQHKITNQQKLLKRFSADDRIGLFSDYISQVEPHDRTNREGPAAKVYFNLLFGHGFHRDQDVVINWALNYGYSILCSMFARMIVSKGYLTEVGIHHINEFNFYNLASDLMEVYRPVVDRIVKREIEDCTSFGKDERRKLLAIFDEKIKLNGKAYTLNHSVQLYVESCMEYLNGDKEKKVLFPSYY